MVAGSHFIYYIPTITMREHPFSVPIGTLSIYVDWAIDRHQYPV